MHVNVHPVDVEAWSTRGRGLSSAAMHERVAHALDVQAHRFQAAGQIDCNARIPEGMFATWCVMEQSAERVFVEAQKSLKVSARARGHIVRVARTIADLDGAARIALHHVTEALGYRSSAVA